jgi:hypothetical protein
MRYICPKCGETVAVKPPSGTCRLCGAALVAEPEAAEAEERGEHEGLAPPKRRR